MSGQRLLVQGVHLHAEVREPQAAADGAVRTLVLLHGFTGSAAGWGDLLDAFAAARLRVIALDMLGHGASDAPTDACRYSLEHCTEDIPAALALLGVAPGAATLLGYSMGGRIALGTALAHPVYFRALVLESASPGLASEQERATRRAADGALAERIERNGVAAFVADWERLPLWATQDALPATVRAALHAQRLRNSATGLAQSLRGVGTGAQPALHSQLATLTLPTLVLAGALDAKFSQIAQQMAAALPAAQLSLVPDAGHAVHLEQPHQFVARVLAFMGALAT